MVDLLYSGFFLNGKMIEDSDQGRIWLYMTTLQTVAVFDLPEEYPKSVSMQEFRTLQNSRLWKEQLLPAAERESAAFKKQNDEYWRKPHPQNQGNVPPKPEDRSK